MLGFNVFVNSVNSNYVSFGQLHHMDVPDFMLMLCYVCVVATGCQTSPASKWALAPYGGEKTELCAEYSQHIIDILDCSAPLYT